MYLPGIVAHADWSTCPAKRWVCVARRSDDGGHYAVDAPLPVGDIRGFLERLKHMASDGCVFVGFDFPIGLPLAFAASTGIGSFRAALDHFGSGEWSEFFELCADADEIGLRRPFYPKRPGGTRQAHLVRALGVADVHALRRRCEKKTDERSAASPLFWTLGAKQVGRAAIAGWRDLLKPALERDTRALRMWPFDGPLDVLLEAGAVVVAETYPAESGLHIGLPATGRGWSKRSGADRARHAGVMRAWADSRTVAISPPLLGLIATGFGDAPEGEDPFDATVGVMGMLEVVLGGRAEMPDLAEDVLAIEGWILGQG